MTMEIPHSPHPIFSFSSSLIHLTILNAGIFCGDLISTGATLSHTYGCHPMHISLDELCKSGKPLYLFTDMIISTVFSWPNSQNVSEFIKIRQLRLKSWSWRIHYGQHCLETKSPFCLFDCVFSRLLYMVFSPYSSYRNSQSFDWIWKNTFHTRCIHTLVCICYFANS